MGASLYKFCVWLQYTSSIGKGMRNSLYPFPTIETIHLFGIILLVGSAWILDLRLLGLMLKNEPVSKLAKRTQPWMWAGLFIQIVTGFFLAATEATKLYNSDTFRLKMLLIVLAGANAMFFYYVPYRSVRSWDTAEEIPLGAKLAGFVSILLWAGVITAGRWIAYY